MKTKRVFVTGASGFIGRFTLPLLVERDFEVFAISSQCEEKKENNINWIECDLLNSKEVGKIFELHKPTHLLHFAWYTEHGKFWSGKENLDWVAASIDLLQNFSRNGGLRVVMAGSCAEYDWNVDKDSYLEDDVSFNNLSLYGSCKAALHKILESFSKIHNISSAWGRIFYLFGPFENPNKLIASVINSLISKEETIKCSHCNQIRDFLYVKDVADGFVSLLDSNIGGAMNIASGRGIVLKEVLSKVEIKLEKKDKILFGALNSSKVEPKRIIAGVDRLKKELNWMHKYDVDLALDETIKWWKKQLNR